MKNYKSATIGKGVFLMILCGALNTCDDVSSRNKTETGERNRIMGTGEKTKIKPLSADDFFLEAVRRGDMAGARKHLNKGAKITARDGLSSTALLLAARKSNNTELTKFLWARGAHVPGFVDQPDNLGRTPLSWAAQYGRLGIMNFLMGKGAGIERKDTSGRTPLFHAVMAGNIPAARSLLTAGANPNPRDKFGDTPLMSAAMKSRTKLVSILLAGGAKRDIKNQEGKTAYQRARDPRIKVLLKR